MTWGATYEQKQNKKHEVNIKLQSGYASYEHRLRDQQDCGEEEIPKNSRKEVVQRSCGGQGIGSFWEQEKGVHS